MTQQLEKALVERVVNFTAPDAAPSLAAEAPRSVPLRPRIPAPDARHAQPLSAMEGWPAYRTQPSATRSDGALSTQNQGWLAAPHTECSKPRTIDIMQPSTGPGAHLVKKPGPSWRDEGQMENGTRP